MEIEESDCLGNDQPGRPSVIAVKCLYVEQLIIMFNVTALYYIEANRFRNCITARFTQRVYVPLFLRQPVHE